MRSLADMATAAPILLPTFARRMYSDSYRKIFFEDSDIVDKFATAIWVEDTCFYVNFYRITSQGRFNARPDPAPAGGGAGRERRGGAAFPARCRSRMAIR